MLYQGLQDGLRVAAHDADLNPWILLQKAGDQLRQQILANRLGGAQRQPSNLDAGGRRHCFTRLLSKRCELGGKRQQGSTGRSERDPAAGPIE